MMWWDDGGGWNAGSWILMTLMMLLFWGGLAALVVWLVRSLREDRTPVAPAPPRPTPDDVLAERLARGEIDAEEYTRRRALIHSPHASA
jgi:putative membrane protein